MRTDGDFTGRVRRATPCALREGFSATLRFPAPAFWLPAQRPSTAARRCFSPRCAYLALIWIVSAQAKTFGQLKSAKVVMLPDASYFVFVSNEQEGEKDIKDFLAAHSSQKGN
jgi:hypothetical protein